MKTRAINFNIDYYDSLIKQHGYDIKSLDWSNKKAQEDRFKTLTDIGDLSGCKILDVGCGFGDLYKWLNKQEIQVNYTGIDINPNFIKIAKEKTTGQFHVSSLLAYEKPINLYDYCLASGIFYLVINKPYEFLELCIKKMLAMSKIGIAFNLLSDVHPNKEEGEFYANKNRVINLCESLGDKTVIVDNYHVADFTVYIYL